MGTWYTNDAEFFAAANSLTSTLFDDLSVGYYTQPLSLFNGTVVAMASANFEVILAGGSEKTIRNPTGIVLSFVGYNAFGVYVNFTDISGNIQQDELYVQVIGLGDSLIHTLENAGDDFIGYINNDMIYTPVEIDFTVNTYGSTNFPGFEGLYFNMASREITEPQILTSENIDNLTTLSSSFDLSTQSVESEELISNNSIESIINNFYIESDENISTSLLYTEAYIESTPIESVENLNIEVTDAQSYIYPNSITSQESLSKQKMYPTPYPGKIYFWYEQIHSIEFELNVRSQQ